MIYGCSEFLLRSRVWNCQIRNIKKVYPDSIIVSEEYTGTTTDRPEWNKLYKRLRNGDTIVFDSVFQNEQERNRRIYSL